MLHKTGNNRRKKIHNFSTESCVNPGGFSRLIGKSGIFLVVFLVMSSICQGGEADVLEVKIEKRADGYINVFTTVQHDDEGWEHYVDRWEILDMDGTLLDTRVLMHPHSHKPFTRSISSVKISSQVKTIRLRAHDSVHGYGGNEVIVEMP